MSRVLRGTPASDAYLDLQGQAQRMGRPTQKLLQLYVLEGFLARLAVSDMHDSFVLKGGVLLAAYDTRRPTKDVDLAGLNLAGDTEAVLELVRPFEIPSLSRQDGPNVVIAPGFMTRSLPTRHARAVQRGCEPQILVKS